jgi:hypothetical protein
LSIEVLGFPTAISLALPSIKASNVDVEAIRMRSWQTEWVNSAGPTKVVSSNPGVETIDPVSLEFTLVVSRMALFMTPNQKCRGQDRNRKPETNESEPGSECVRGKKVASRNNFEARKEQEI